MDAIKNILLLILFICFGGLSLQAQLKDAESLYNDYGYKTSTIIYEDLVEKTGVDLEIKDLRKIANSYRLVHDTEAAESWYARFIGETTSSIDFLHYAQALQSNGNTTAAKEYFLKYDAANGGDDERGKRLATAIDRMNQFKENDTRLKNVAAINSEKLEFSPRYYEDGIVFVSTRKNSTKKSKKDIWIDDNYMSLFYAPLNKDSEAGSVKDFSTQINSPYHEGPVAFNSSADVIYFTRNNYNNKKVKKNSKNAIILKIFTAEKIASGWGEAKELPFNTEDFDECHPALSPDGKTLYFASNRNGGQGGMDLYASNFENGAWGAPVNLGPEINTEGNEIFPFVHDDGTLYFASNGWGGLGGLDIFSSTQATQNSTWLTATNLGKPFNSAKDDFGFVLNVLGSEGYLSSARGGNDDIYSFKTNAESINKPSPVLMESTITTLGADNLPIGNVTYTVKATNKKTGEVTENTYTSNADGALIINMLPDHEYEFIASKDGYKTASKTFTTEGMYNNDALSILIPLVKEGCLSLSGTTNSKDDNLRLGNASITLKNLCTQKTEVIQSNMIGKFEFGCLDPNCAYEITATKAGYGIAAGKIQMSESQKTMAEAINLVLNLERTKTYSDNSNSEFNSKSGAYNSDSTTSSGSTSNSGNYNGSSTNTSSGYNSTYNTSGSNASSGTLLELEDIYYDFDDYEIRPDAAQVLDELVAILRTYPDMKILLTAHTDSRGSQKYNQRLSRKRAEYATWYLLKKGINKNRLTYYGYGETQIRNQCREGVDCSDDDHEFNRRTMIRINE